MYLFLLLNKLAEFLPPLFAHFRHDGVQQPELLAPLIHLVIWVLEHHLETVVHQEIFYGLGETQRVLCDREKRFKRLVWKYLYCGNG